MRACQTAVTLVESMHRIRVCVCSVREKKGRHQGSQQSHRAVHSLAGLLAVAEEQRRLLGVDAVHRDVQLFGQHCKWVTVNTRDDAATQIRCPHVRLASVCRLSVNE